MTEGGEGGGPLLAPGGDCGAAAAPPLWWSRWWADQDHVTDDSSFLHDASSTGETPPSENMEDSYEVSKCLGRGGYRNIGENPLPVRHLDSIPVDSMRSLGGLRPTSWFLHNVTHDTQPGCRCCQELIWLRSPHYSWDTGCSLVSAFSFAEEHILWTPFIKHILNISLINIGN